MNLRSEIRNFANAHEGRAPEDLAAMFIQGCHPGDLLPLVVEAFKWEIRAAVRAAEVAALSALPVAGRPEFRRAGLDDDLRELLDRPYRIGDGHQRRFGAMTPDEHLTRIAMLESNIAGLQRDIDLHRRAVATCAEYGIACLDELAIKAELVA